MGLALNQNSFNPDKEKVKLLIETIESLIPELSHNHADSYFVLMRLCLMQRNVEGALKQFQKSISENPNNPLPYFEMGKYFSIYHYDKHQDAVDYLTKAITFFW